MTDISPEDKVYIIAANLDAFLKQQVSSVSSATTPITPKVAFKVLTFRESLSQRTLELCQGALDSIKSGNFLSGILLARASLECAAAFHFLTRKLRLCVENDSVQKLDSVAMRLLLGTRWEDWEFQSYNVISMLEDADKEIPGILQQYKNLSEYCHPNYNGVAKLFSNHTRLGEAEIGRYMTGTKEISLVAINALYLSLMTYEYCYNSSADYLPKIVELCARDLEQSH